MRFILDNMISHKFAGALKALDRDVCALREICPPSTADVEWLGELASGADVLITLDKGIRSKPHERLIFEKVGVTTFYLGPFFSKKTFWDQAVWIMRRWPQIEDVARSMLAGAVLLIQENGKMWPLRAGPS